MNGCNLLLLLVLSLKRVPLNHLSSSVQKTETNIPVRAVTPGSAMGDVDAGVAAASI